MNKVYHSINVTIYFLGRKRKKKKGSGRFSKGLFLAAAVILAVLLLKPGEVYGAGKDYWFYGQEPVKAIDPEGPGQEETDQDIPLLYIRTETGIIKKEGSTDVLLSDNRGGSVRIFLSELNYRSGLEQERGDLYVNVDEEGSRSGFACDWESFLPDQDGLWYMDIPLEGKDNKEVRYQITFEYQDQAGHGLQAGDSALAAFGMIHAGRFESVWFVVDDKSPEMDEEIRLQGVSDSQFLYHDTAVMPEHVEGEIMISESNPDLTTTSLAAKPLDRTARQSARMSEQLMPDGTVDIPAYTVEREGNAAIIRMRFQEEGRWQLVFSCRDLAGNEGKTRSGKTQAVSREFIIDTKPPALRISYSSDTCIHRTRLGPEDTAAGPSGKLARVNVKDCQIFFSDQQEVLLEIHEEYFDEDTVEIGLLEEYWEEKSEGGSSQKTASASGIWKQESVRNPGACMNVSAWEKIREGVYRTRITWKKEGNFRLAVHYEDPAGRGLEADNSGTENVSLFLEEGVYQGPLITVDRTAPAILSVLCESGKGPAAGKSGKGRKIFTDMPSIVLRVSDENFSGGNLRIEDRILYADGQEAAKTQADLGLGKNSSFGWERIQKENGTVYEAAFTLPTEGIHTLLFTYTDAAGHSSESKILDLAYDCEGPVVDYEKITGEKGQQIDIRNEDAEGVFLGEKIRIKIRITDHVTGIESLWYRFSGTYCDEIGREYSKTSEYRKLIPESGEGMPSSDWTVWVEPEEDNFIGRLELYCRDEAGNESDLIRSREITGETSRLHDSSSKIEWELSGAVCVSEEDRIMYFGRAGMVKVRFLDSWAGISSWTFLASEEELSASDIRASCKKERRKKKAECIEKEFVLKAGDYPDSSPDRAVKLYAGFIDRAGHFTFSSYDDYRIVPDQTKPEVRVTYDLPESENYGLYFSKPRTACVAVSDMNFNPESVKWNIHGPAGGWQISQWIKKGNVHTCEIYFSKDGDGYGLALKGSDYSGNGFSWDEDRRFVIDQTPPKVTVASSGKKGSDKEKYYSGEQKLRLIIEEENLREKDLVIKNSSREKEKTSDRKMLVPGTLQRDRSGLFHMDLTVGEEGTYAPEFFCTDMAGNKSETVTVPEFTIDRTAPRIVIKGVREGEVVSGPLHCIVGCLDRNIDMSSLQIQMFLLSGREVDAGVLSEDIEVKYDGETVCGMEKSFNESGAMELKDGVYQIRIRGRDLAGNSAAGKTVLPFVVNREGAVYRLEKESRERISDGYFRGFGGIRLTEYCVSPTKTRIKIIRENQDPYELASEDYQMKTGIMPADSRQWAGWIKKDIFLPDSLFRKDGVYRVLIKSKALDRYGARGKVINQTDNEIKGEEISFIVDRTPPQVHLGGLDQAIYEEKEHVFRLTVMDNIALDQVEISVEKGLFKKRKEVTILKPGDFDAMNSILLKLEAYGGYQKLRYAARDKAGNTIDSDLCGDTRNCLIAGIKDSGDQPSEDDRKLRTVTVTNHNGQAGKGWDFFPGLFGGMVLLLLITGSVFIIKDRKKMEVKDRRMKDI